MERAVRFAGSGGQGVALAAFLLADGAVRAGMNATQAQSYGPESRGGASKADVIVSDGPISYPIAGRPDVLVALTSEACARYAGDLAAGALVVVDGGAADRLGGRTDLEVHALPIIAEVRRVLGVALGANLVALGALLALTGLVPDDAIAEGIRARRPGGDPERALRAFRAGLSLARRVKQEVAM